MSPGILEIAKERDDDDLNYLEIEVNENLEFWKGLGIPMIFALIGLFSLLLFEVGIWENCFLGLLSYCCLCPLLGISLIFSSKRNGNENMEYGAWVSIFFYFIILIFLMFVYREFL